MQSEQKNEKYDENLINYIYLDFEFSLDKLSINPARLEYNLITENFYCDPNDKYEYRIEYEGWGECNWNFNDINIYSNSKSDTEKEKENENYNQTDITYTNKWDTKNLISNKISEESKLNKHKYFDTFDEKKNESYTKFTKTNIFLLIESLKEYKSKSKICSDPLIFQYDIIKFSTNSNNLKYKQYVSNYDQNDSKTKSKDNIFNSIFVKCLRCKRSSHSTSQCLRSISLKCTKCLNSNHTGVECLKIPNTNQSIDHSAYCYVCGKIGHFICSLESISIDLSEEIKESTLSCPKCAGNHLLSKCRNDGVKPIFNRLEDNNLSCFVRGQSKLANDKNFLNESFTSSEDDDKIIVTTVENKKLGLKSKSINDSAINKDISKNKTSVNAETIKIDLILDDDI